MNESEDSKELVNFLTEGQDWLKTHENNNDYDQTQKVIKHCKTYTVNQRIFQLKYHGSKEQQDKKGKNKE